VPTKVSIFIRIYEKIGLRYEPLTLVTPTFQVRINFWS